MPPRFSLNLALTELRPRLWADLGLRLTPDLERTAGHTFQGRPDLRDELPHSAAPGHGVRGLQHRRLLRGQRVHHGKRPQGPARGSGRCPVSAPSLQGMCPPGAGASSPGGYGPGAGSPGFTSSSNLLRPLGISDALPPSLSIFLPLFILTLSEHSVQ